LLPNSKLPVEVVLYSVDHNVWKLKTQHCDRDNKMTKDSQ